MHIWLRMLRNANWWLRNLSAFLLSHVAQCLRTRRASRSAGCTDQYRLSVSHYMPPTAYCALTRCKFYHSFRSAHFCSPVSSSRTSQRFTVQHCRSCWRYGIISCRFNFNLCPVVITVMNLIAHPAARCSGRFVVRGNKALTSGQCGSGTDLRLAALIPIWSVYQPLFTIVPLAVTDHAIWCWLPDGKQSSS